MEKNPKKFASGGKRGYIGFAAEKQEENLAWKYRECPLIYVVFVEREQAGGMPRGVPAAMEDTPAIMALVTKNGFSTFPGSANDRCHYGFLQPVNKVPKKKRAGESLDLLL